MKSYSARQLIASCVITAIITVAAGYVFGRTVYTPWQLRRAQALSDLRDPATMREAREAGERLLARRQTKLTAEKQKELMRLWHELGIWSNLYYLGVRIQKNPMDLYMMQQVIFDVRPDYIIEAGTAYGGSAIYWAHILDGLGLDESKVLTIDITRYEEEAEQQPLWKKHVEFLHGSSTDPAIVERIRQRVAGKKVLVVLDSNHAADHVLNELRAYGPMVSQGSYIVVEDTNLDALPLPDMKFVDGTGGGPMAAVTKYLSAEGAALFEQDPLRENFVMTFNPGGWLKRK
jgi:cephalosporin hydroxylase